MCFFLNFQDALLVAVCRRVHVVLYAYNKYCEYVQQQIAKKQYNIFRPKPFAKLSS